MVESAGELSEPTGGLGGVPVSGDSELLSGRGRQHGRDGRQALVGALGLELLNQLLRLVELGRRGRRPLLGRVAQHRVAGECAGGRAPHAHAHDAAGIQKVLDGPVQ